MAPRKAGPKGDGAGKGRNSAAKKRSPGPDLASDLRRFVTENPQGWGHNEWLGLLAHLRDRGHAVEDTEQIGRMLERERLAATLERVQGVGPQRVRAISERYGSIWNLLYADVDDLVHTTNIPRSLAERIKLAV